MSSSLFNGPSILAGLKFKNLGLSIQVGTFAHADNIRITTTNPDDTAEKVKTVASFADRNGLNSFLGGMPPGPPEQALHYAAL